MPPRGILALLAVLVWAVPAQASDCDSPGADWLMCEDFEGGAEGWAAWFGETGFVECRGCEEGLNNPDRLILSDDAAHVYDGSWAMHMPARAEAGFRGAELIYHSCADDPRPGCELTNYERLYLRTRVKLAPDHEYVHHFLSIGGTRPGAYWEGSGNAGCRPDGVRAASTTLDFSADRNLWFYTYHPEMRCDAGGYCSGDYAQGICDGCAERGLGCSDGLECCWGNRFEPETPRAIERGEWVCLEIMMQINTPGEADGEMAFWYNDQLGHRETGIRWRDVPELGLNRANMSHYIDAGDADQPNAVSFDDFIVSTSRIGCDLSPGPAPDAGPDFMDGGVDGGALLDGGGLNDDAGVSRDAGTSVDVPENGGCSIQPRPPLGALFLLAGWLRLRRPRKRP